METLPYIQTTDAKPFMKAADEKTCFLPLQDTDPVVYKLVRVDGDGRLIPATDDEILEVEDLLEVDKDELHHDEDIGFFRGGVVIDQPSSRNAGIDTLEDSQTLGVNGEKLKVLHGAGDHSSSRNERSPAADKEHISDCFVSNSKDGSNVYQRSISDCSHDINRMDDIGKSTSDNTIVTDDDICLEKLSLKELQETFKSTFGRETFVKDKVWLKRRIAMGLTNIYDIPTTDFIIRGKTIIVQDVLKASLPDDTSVVFSDICGAMLDSTEKLENQDILTDTSFIICDMKHEELQNQEVHAADVVSKRVRKPTKRYIEEHSDVETREHSGRSISAAKTSGLISSPKSHVNSAPANHSARHDTFAGYGFQIPHVSRVRRGHPRQDYMAFRIHQSDRLAVKDPVDVQSSQNEGHIGSKIFSEAYSDRIQQASGEHPDRVMDSKQLVPVAFTSQFQDGADIDNGEHLGDGRMNGNIATVSTAKGGMRRKHHRAWTLSEVVKLVEGVSRYGAGRWSEIKRVAFPSYTCRTSVDLKDKWRNLLKASNSQESSGGSFQNSRKQTSIPIPPHILIRVRELAARQAKTQSKPDLGMAQTDIPSGNHQEIKTGHC